MKRARAIALDGEDLMLIAAGLMMGLSVWLLLWA